MLLNYGREEFKALLRWPYDHIRVI